MNDDPASQVPAGSFHVIHRLSYRSVTYGVVASGTTFGLLTGVKLPVGTPWSEESLPDSLIRAVLSQYGPARNPLPDRLDRPRNAVT